MRKECESCPASGDGCRPQNWRPLVEQLLALAGSKQPGVEMVSAPLQAIAGCLAAAKGCQHEAWALLFPLNCTCRGLVEYLDFTKGKAEASRLIEDLLEN